LLKTRVSHFFGSQERWNTQLVRLDLDTKDLNELEALENGWLIWDDRWYNCRSVRIRIDDYKPYKTPKSITAEYTEDLNIISQIYKEFREYKGYAEEYDLFLDSDRSEWLLLKDAGDPVAFTKFKKYDGGLESEFTALNYHSPKLSIGKVIVNYEVDYAKSLGYKHLYIGQGCETGSVYKSSFPGFEWWDGNGWTTDQERYRFLCKRDSTINTIDQINELFNGKVR
jgi:hypothetical protein